MLRRYTWLNILLLLVLFFLGRQTYGLLHNPLPPTIEARPSKTPPESWQPSRKKMNPPIKDSYRIISEKNLFHPQRKWGSGVKREKGKKTLFSQTERPKDLILYGILIYGQQKYALVGHGRRSGRSPGDKRRVSIGDSFAGYQIVDISPSQITVRRDDKLETIKVYASKKDRKIAPLLPPYRRPPARTKPPTSKPLPKPYKRGIKRK